MKKSGPLRIEAIQAAHVSSIRGRITEGASGETYSCLLLLPDRSTVGGYTKICTDKRHLISELACALLGRAIGLRIPRPFLAVLDSSKIPADSANKDTGQLFCFASQQAGRGSYSLERAIQTPVSEAALLHDLSSAAAFDELIANDDRNMGNMIYSPESKDVWMIDHGRALTGPHWALWGLDNPAIAVGNLVADDATASNDRELCNKALEMGRKLVDECVKLEFESMDEGGLFEALDPSISRDEIITFLSQRTLHTVSLLCQRMNIGQEPMLLMPQSF